MVSFVLPCEGLQGRPASLARPPSFGTRSPCDREDVALLLESTRSSAASFDGVTAPPPGDDSSGVSLEESLHFLSRLAFAVQLAGALLVGLIVASGDRTDSFGLALNCVVCSVAAVHYYALLDMRSQYVESTTRETNLNTIETRADAIRYSDWLITLPLLGVEVVHMLHRLPSLARRDDLLSSPPLTALLLFGTVVFGGAWRAFVETETRFGASILCYVLSLLLFATAVFLIYFDLSRVEGEEDSKVAVALYLFVGVWCVYPAITLPKLIGSFSKRDTSEMEIFVKDLLFAACDVLSKAGLAYYAATRASSTMSEAELNPE